MFLTWEFSMCLWDSMLIWSSLCFTNASHIRILKATLSQHIELVVCVCYTKIAHLRILKVPLGQNVAMFVSMFYQGFSPIKVSHLRILKVPLGKHVDLVVCVGFTNILHCLFHLLSLSVIHKTEHYCYFYHYQWCQLKFENKMCVWIAMSLVTTKYFVQNHGKVHTRNRWRRYGRIAKQIHKLKKKG